MASGAFLERDGIRTPWWLHRLALIGPPLVALTFGALIYGGLREWQAHDAVYERSLVVVAELREVLSRLKDAETSVRGFALTRDPAFLAPGRGVREDIVRRLGAMRVAITDPVQRQHLGELVPLVEAKLDHADSTALLLRSAGLSDAALRSRLEVGRQEMDAVRRQAARMEARQATLLALRHTQANRYARMVAVLVIVGSVVVGVFTLLLNRLLAGYTSALEANAQELFRQNLSLDEQAVELEIQAAELEEHADALQRANAALRAHEEYLRTVIDTEPNPVFVKDREGRYVLANAAAARAFGTTPQEMVGKRDSDFVSVPDQVERLEAGDREVIRTGSSQVITEAAVTRRLDGTTRWFYIRRVPLSAPGLDERHVLGISLDITERRAAEEALRTSQEAIQRAQGEILERLAQAAEFRDDDTGQHTRRVGELSARIALALSLGESTAALIRRAAPLHDVGKIGIPDSILLKPGRLTPEEFEVMKTHTTVGAAILSRGESAPMTMAEQIALCHHERWDGSGYPQGLRGEAIPVAARIVALADFYDALSSDRPYRPAWPLDRVVAEIEQGVGRHFDPTVARVFLRLLGESGLAA